MTALAALVIAALPAAAHDHVHVDPYEFTVGWTTEPSVLGAPNGLDLGINVDVGNNTTAPVLNAHNDLTATVSFGTISAPKALAPQFGQPGWYTFDIIPTREGTYSVRIVGTLNGTAINISVDLESPEARADLEFPITDPSPTELAANLGAAQFMVAQLTARVAALEASSGGGNGTIATRLAALEADNASLKSTATLAELLAVVGLLAGVAGVALAMRAKRTPPKSGSK